jgi:hypothetical protein
MGGLGGENRGFRPKQLDACTLFLLYRIDYRPIPEPALPMKLTSAGKLKLLAEFLKSKASATEFSRTRGVSRATLNRWVKVEQIPAKEAQLEGPQQFRVEGRPRAIGPALKKTMKADLESAQAARDAAWKAIRSGRKAFRRTRRPRLTLAQALAVARAAGYEKSESTFVRYLHEIGFETARKYRHRRGSFRAYGGLKSP